MDELLEMAQELDGMERDLETTWEVDFLENMLTLLRNGQSLSPNREAKLRQIHDKYLGDGAQSGGDSGDVFM
jgi:hypothetical protein